MTGIIDKQPCEITTSLKMTGHNALTSRKERLRADERNVRSGGEERERSDQILSRSKRKWSEEGEAIADIK